MTKYYLCRKHLTGSKRENKYHAMKKISNEVKVGATAVITIVVFIWLYNYLKGKDLLSSTASYYAIYENIGGLTESNPVEINGYKAGVVQSINFINDKSGRLLVKLSIEKGFTLPENTIAEVTTASLIAGMKIRLIFGDGPGVYKNGDTIPGRMAESILTTLENEIGPLKEKVESMIISLDSVLTGINEVLTPQFTADVRGSMANLSNTTKSLDDVISSKKAELKTMIDSFSKFSAMLASNSDKFDNTISNLSSVSDTIVSADIYNTINNLKSTLEMTSALLSGMNEGKGTTGQLFTNDSLYSNLSNSLESLNLLLEDMKANPKRYVQFSLFGRKN